VTSPAITPTRSRTQALQDHVTAQVTRLQAAYLGQSPAATATLAHLRGAVAAEAGSVPSVWDVTLAGLDPRLVGRGDDPSPAERAAHAALCLYAVHQQSQRTGMHQTGVGLGTAVRRLATRVGAESAVERRFHALGTSATVAEALHHARGLVGRLRAEQIPLDYGRFAVDLHDLQYPDRAGAVRLRWGRDFHRVRDERAGSPDTTTDLTDSTADSTDDTGDDTNGAPA
jgi:CRISPR system Cascade subunit CasB